MSDPVVVHWMPPREGATHAVPDVLAARYTTDPAEVTCPVCRGHLPTDDDGDAGVVQG